MAAPVNYQTLHQSPIEAPSKMSHRMPRDCIGLIRYQHASYNVYHATPRIVRLHLWAVPLFQLGNVAAITAPFLLLVPVSTGVAVAVGVGGLVLSAISMALQGRAHATEKIPNEPLEGPVNAIQRIFSEQWINFPRFVLEGGWRVAFEAEQGSNKNK
ncbi:Aste57867_19825 [Aphanomyces stellatus]|uniref:Aste57867_19825 protein n=1 Tax=Aphanomyces stellatus TaxID=120398 RepID=A0A485LE19_9STRA|nr:hypothetical protein As57867_019760 [Aphanomyces stellatus]VFT96523.1 Aste57867_19825 [Aphanomyces stellatus]